MKLKKKLFCIFHFSDVCMIGDDVRDDVLGAQNAGFQVLTYIHMYVDGLNFKNMYT